MKRLWLGGLACVLLVLSFIALPIFATSTITGATYMGTVQVVNVSTAATNVSVPFTLSTVDMVADGYFNSDCLNTAMRYGGVDAPYMPAEGAGTAWIFFIPTISANITETALLYTGGADMNGTIRYFPDAAGMSIADSATLELGTTFSVEQKGRIDTTAGASKNLIYKVGAFQTYVSGAGTITSVISETKAHYYDTGDDTDQAVGDNWGGNTYDAAQSFTTTTVLNVTSISVLCKKGLSGGVGNSTVSIRLMGVAPSTNPALTTGVGNMDANGWVNFDVADITLLATTQYVIVFDDTAGDAYWRYDSTGAYAGGSRWDNPNEGGWSEQAGTDLLFRINVTPTVSMAVASGEHTVTTTADATNLRIYLDGVLKATALLSGTSVIDNANAYTLLENNCMPYMEYTKITVGATLQSEIRWENDTTFTDLSAHGHNATPTFRTTTTDGDVSASLIKFEPTSLSIAGSITGAGGQTIIASGDLPDQPIASGVADMYAEGETGGLLGLGPLIDPVLFGAGIPAEAFWFPIAYAVSIALGFAAFGWTKQLIVQAFVSGIVMACFCGGGTLGDGLLPWFNVLIFGIEAVILLIIQEKYAV